MKLAAVLTTSWLVNLVTGQAPVDPLDIYRHYHVCDICPQDGAPTMESLGLPYDTSGAKTLSCDEARTLAEDGRYSPAACILLRMRLHEDCGCDIEGSLPAVTDETPTPPLEALNAKEQEETNVTEIVSEPEVTVAEETDDTETVLGSEVAESVVEKPEANLGKVVRSTSTVLLAPVPTGSLEGAQTAAFESSMEEFLDAKIQGLQDLECQITDQHVSSSKLVSAVEVVVTCQGRSTSMSSHEFQEVTSTVVAKDAPELLASVRSNPNFIKNVATIFNFDDENTESDDVAPEKYVWITAGAFGVGGVAILCVFMVIFTVKAIQMKNLRKPAQDGSKKAFSFGRTKSTRLSKMPIPVAAAAAVAALVRESTDPEVKVLAEEDATITVESAATMSTLRRDMNSRSVLAPAGKLGITIDTTLEGPVIHAVKPTSPIFGLVFPGDIVIAVNNEDTRAMCAVSLTALMARTSAVERELVVLSQDVVG